MKNWSIEQLVNFIMNSLQDGFLLNQDIKGALVILKEKAA
jgi:hypothetical protein